MNFSKTITGRKLYPARPSSKQIYLFDIAYGLANVCRYSGQSKGFTSVLNHSLRVAARLPFRLKIYGLLHDASEAYIGELPRGTKRLCADYKKVEMRVENCILKSFGLKPLTNEEKKVLAEADQQDALAEIAGEYIHVRRPDEKQIAAFMDQVIDEHKKWINGEYDGKFRGFTIRNGIKVRSRKSRYSPY